MLRDVYYTILFAILILVIIGSTGSINDHVEMLNDAVSHQCRVIVAANDN